MTTDKAIETVEKMSEDEKVKLRQHLECSSPTLRYMISKNLPLTTDVYESLNDADPDDAESQVELHELISAGILKILVKGSGEIQ